MASADSTDEAVSVAIARSGAMLNPDLDYVTISAAAQSHGDCDATHAPTFVVAGDTLVALEDELTVFDADSEEHATRIARREPGDHLVDVPLSVESIEPLPDQQEEARGDGESDLTDGTANDDTTHDGTDDITSESPIYPAFEDAPAQEAGRLHTLSTDRETGLWRTVPRSRYGTTEVRPDPTY